MKVQRLISELLKHPMDLEVVIYDMDGNYKSVDIVDGIKARKRAIEDGTIVWNYTFSDYNSEQVVHIDF